ncbi:leucine-rich repeat-containing protein 4C-like [Uloborus diversus]|uniref:leucine-rich repeat-containing protein 4C-like n=1 Tax=Uloborus diversus TaxID=327109 RepID=UPI0024094F8F|nr:leucine-rich repeat-containing protein 4C-like [Uloborus diversus]
MKLGTLFLTLISVTVIFISLLQSNLACPSVCSCKWKNGKKTAECTGQGITIIPANLDEGTQVIDISRNSFNEIPSRVFQKKMLTNLQKIFMAECSISRIASDAFFQLSNLVELDLSGNQLETVPTEALNDCPNIRRLQLAHNPIEEIDDGMFSSLSHLTFLGLSNCRIKHLQPGALKGLNRIEVIELDGNQLTQLSIDVFEPLQFLFGLHLNDNPWHCDCKIRFIREWMMNRNIPLAVPPRCETPRSLNGITWEGLSLEEFACPPKMINVPKEFTVVSGNNASILCQVNATPKASIHWEVNGRSLRNLSFTPELKAKYSVDEDLARQTSILVIYNTIEKDSDTYTCIAENRAGTASINFTLTVACASRLNVVWKSTHILAVVFGILALLILCSVVALLFIYRPSSLFFCSKLTRKNVLQHMPSKRQDNVEMNDVSTDKEEKDQKVTDKQPRHETGSSGYGSDQLTPDLVSKIADTNNGPSLSASTASCNHLESDNSALIVRYATVVEHWPLGKENASRFDTSPFRNHMSQVYLNPFYSKHDDDAYNCALQSTGGAEGHIQLPDSVGDRYIPQNNRVRTLRGGYDCTGDLNRDDLYNSHIHDDAFKRHPIVVANSSSHFNQPAKLRFSPDEGYAEEGLEGTEV